MLEYITSHKTYFLNFLNNAVRALNLLLFSCADFLPIVGVKDDAGWKLWQGAPSEMGSLLLRDVLGLRFQL